MRNISARALACTLSLAVTIGTGYCQTDAPGQYPSKPITIIAAGPGGAVDLVARVLAQGIAGELKQGVVVENRPSSVVPNQMVARAQPDGHTLLYSGAGMWVTSLVQEVPYDPVRDFAPISLVHDAPQILVTHPSLPVKSVKELVALAKARPGQIHFAASNVGSASTLAGEMFAHMAGVNIVRIPYKSSGSRMIGLLSGEVQLEFATGAGYSAQMKLGKLKALGVTALKPTQMFPGVPPIADTLPGYESSQAGGLFAPAKTPAAIVNRLSEEVKKLLKRAEVREKIVGAGIDVVGSSPQEFAIYIQSTLEKMDKVIKARGLRETR
jgi:tripartite-type tricarboxylate transporter receptor subunit TctC